MVLKPQLSISSSYYLLFDSCNISEETATAALQQHCRPEAKQPRQV